MKKRRILLLLLAAATALLMGTAALAEGFDIQYTGAGEGGQIAGGYSTTLFQLENPDGTLSHAYCVDQETYIQPNSRYARTNLGQSSYYDDSDARQIRAIVLNAYPAVSLEELCSSASIHGLTAAQAIAGAQTAIWHYANSGSYGGHDASVKALYDWYLALPPAEPAAQPVGQVELSGSSEGAADGSVTARFRYRASGVNADGTPVHLTHAFDRDVEGVYGASVTSGQGAEGYTEVTVTGLPVNAAFLFSVSGEQAVTRDVYFYEPQGGRGASQSLVGAYEGTTALYGEVPFSYIPTGGFTLTIQKVDGVTLQGLQGAVLELSDTEDFSGQVIRQTTGEDGRVTWNGLTQGTWYVREAEAPAGYIPYEGVFPVEVTAYTREQTFKNTAYGGIEIVKIDDTQGPVAGVHFCLYSGQSASPEAVVAADLITDDEGIIQIDHLLPGVYTIVETGVPEGWHINPEPQTITVESGKQTQVTITNPRVKRGRLLLYKRDAVTGEQLPGAVIGVYRDENHTDLIKEFTTSVSEAAALEELLPGTYYIKENQVPQGYLMDSSPQVVTLAEGESRAVVFYNNQIPQTAGNYGLLLLIGGALTAVIGALLVVFRKRLFSGGKE